MLVHSLLLLALTAAVRLCARRGAACGDFESLLLLLMLETTEAVAQPGLGGCRRARRLCRFYMRVCNSTSFQLYLMWHTGRQSPSYGKGG